MFLLAMLSKHAPRVREQVRIEAPDIASSTMLHQGILPMQLLLNAQLTAGSAREAMQTILSAVGVLQS